MRLYAQRPEQQPGRHRPAIDEQGCGREETGGQKPVLPETDRPQDRRKRQDRDQDRPAGLAKDPAHDQKVEREAHCLEDDKGRDIG
jgi:hypothetical protein